MSADASELLLFMVIHYQNSPIYPQFYLMKTIITIVCQGVWGILERIRPHLDRRCDEMGVQMANRVPSGRFMRQSTLSPLGTIHAMRVLQPW